VRNLFSNFASGRPALGLLLIRIATGVSLVIDGIMRLHLDQPILPSILGLFTVGDGVLLLAGLWTPLAGPLVVAVFTGGLLVCHDNFYPGILLATMGAGLALVGPGAISVDAWIFGLKKIDIEKLNGSPHR